MDSNHSSIDNNKTKNEKNPEEMALLGPRMQHLTVAPIQSTELCEAMNPLEMRRGRKSYDYQQDLPIARLPRQASSASLFLEYVSANFM